MNLCEKDRRLHSAGPSTTPGSSVATLNLHSGRVVKLITPISASALLYAYEFLVSEDIVFQSDSSYSRELSKSSETALMQDV
jgi:hypothetical protein